jgi:organic hydroperoxide reductase OsmC/OhrA
MKITASLQNAHDEHSIVVSTDGNEKRVEIRGRAGGGSSVNGGELLFTALATCFCNDIYREAAKRGITVSGLTVHVEGEFGGEGEPARNIVYRASITADASDEEICDLMAHTDRVAEIQNSLRGGVDVRLLPSET